MINKKYSIILIVILIILVGQRLHFNPQNYGFPLGLGIAMAFWIGLFTTRE